MFIKQGSPGSGSEQETEVRGFDFLVRNWDGEGWLDPYRCLGAGPLWTSYPPSLSPGECYGEGASVWLKIQTCAFAQVCNKINGRVL